EVGAVDEVKAVFQDRSPSGGVNVQKVRADLTIAQPGALRLLMADGTGQPTYVASKKGGLLVRELDMDEDADGECGTDKLTVHYATKNGDKGALTLEETTIPGRFEAILKTEYKQPDPTNAEAELGVEDTLTVTYVDFAGG